MTPSAQATASRITPLLERRVRHVLARLPKAFDGDEDAIHELRIAARRLRVVLPLLLHKPDGRRVRHAKRRLRTLTRAFGESRDLDVVLALLVERVRALDASPERAALVKRLRHERKRARNHMAGSVAELDPRKLRRQLRKLVPRVDPTAHAIERMRAARAERGRELRAMLIDQAARFDAEALHQIRIRARKLRYIAEAIDALRAKDSPAPALLRQMQDDLGQIHDAHVLAEWLEARAIESEAHADEAIAAEARALSRYFRGRARLHHRAFLATQPRANLASAVAIMKNAERAPAHSNGVA